jgi:mono/diheme cytochrome c family protein
MRILYSLLPFLAVPLAAQVSGVTPAQEKKALELLRVRLPCLGCHELAGDGGRIGPSLTDVGRRRNASYIAAIIEDPQRVTPAAAMPKVLMPASTRALIVGYLAQSTESAVVAAGPARASSAPSAPKTQPTGVALYARWCSSCHGPAGGGDGPNAKFLPVRPAVHASAAQMTPRSDDALFDAIAGGGGVMGKSVRMPPFGATLSSSEIRSIVAYIRALCACKGPTWSLDGRR